MGGVGIGWRGGCGAARCGEKEGKGGAASAGAVRPVGVQVCAERLGMSVRGLWHCGDGRLNGRSEAGRG